MKQKNVSSDIEIKNLIRRLTRKKPQMRKMTLSQFDKLIDDYIGAVYTNLSSGLGIRVSIKRAKDWARKSLLSKKNNKPCFVFDKDEGVISIGTHPDYYKSVLLIPNPQHKTL